jgi:imidazolonepropionase-like amidohydrolase
MKNMLLSCLALPLLLITAFPGFTQTIIRADGYVDVKAGKVVKPAIIYIEDNKIIAINPDELPDNAKEISLPGQILLPGLIDMHTHLTNSIAGDWTNRPVRETSADAAYRGAKNARKTLLAGFTTVRNLGSNGFVDIALEHAIQKGFVMGPRIIPAGYSLGITGGHCDTTGFIPGLLERDYRTGVADGIDEVTKAVRYQIKHGAKVIKFCATAGILSFEGPAGAQQYSQAEMDAIVTEAHRHGIKVAAHAHGAKGIKAAIRAGVDSVEHASLADDEARKLAKEKGTYFVMNIYPPGQVDIDALPEPLQVKARYVFPRREQNFTKAVKAGIKMAYGTDAGVYPHGNNANQFAVKVSLGQSSQDAIRSATLWAVDLLDIKDRGKLEANKLADIIAVPGNPLDDISLLEQVSFVMKDGNTYKMPSD